LNFESLGYDLTDTETFRQWEQIFDRVRNGEMPPKKKKRPNPKQLELALGSLGNNLREANLASQEKMGRVPHRRLTRLEYGYTVRDLLLIESGFEEILPGESKSGSFDTVGSTHRISAVHVQSYLKGADHALDNAINLNKNPYHVHVFNYLRSSFLNSFHDKELSLGGNMSRKLKDGVAVFRDVDYLLKSDIHGFRVKTAGIYRIVAKAEAFQAKKPVALKVIVKNESGGVKLVGAFDLIPGKTHTIELEIFLKPGDSFYPTMEDELSLGQIFGAIARAGGARKYKGVGFAIKTLKVEGPLSKMWPPQSTRDLLAGVHLKRRLFGSYQVDLTKKPIEHVSDVIERIAPQAFRRPPIEGELKSFVELAKPAIEEGLGFADVVRVPLRSILSSPQFLLFDEKSGKLNDYALANRLSYFLWKSMPDEQLFTLAKEGKLSRKEVLSEQVERMLSDEKAERFIRDFMGQWLRLYDIDATTPDEKLYPDYDELLGRAMPKETELFFTEMVKKNLGISNLVDSGFTFVNRRLAKHYGLKSVAGQDMRRVSLPKDSPRGGVLTQASILKATANGTVTSPVTRGNYVLSNLLGTPPSPPPPDAGSIEPDTRGKTTIREILAAHRNIETCAKCHREIDPPGFALESFDPIGGYRTRYRANAGGLDFFTKKSYKDGPAVDASGVTADGKKFSGIKEFKKHMLAKKDQIARHFISQLVVYSTGGEIQFADREEIDSIVDHTRKADFPVRTIIHEVIQSKMFRNK
jgi:hypothetical protein